METKVSGETHPHLPVLYHEVLFALNPVTGGRYIDGTLGAGGHSRGILEMSSPDGMLLGMDLDPAALEIAKKNLAKFADRSCLIHASYKEMKAQVEAHGWQKVNGILLDLGVSSIQLDNPEKGFSFRTNSRLDMRFNPQTGKTAADLVNMLTETELQRILWDFGEEQNAKRIVRSIIQSRPLHMTGELSMLIEKTVGKSKKGIHPATRTFQALRIAVNDELKSVSAVLPEAVDLLEKGGRLAVITFHSLEDRIVKHFFQQESKNCICPTDLPVCQCGHQASIKMLKPHFIQPGEDELKTNPRARSAKLRVVEKI
jgi:16S rRNA (cytosine1402-N4)-methyltransferase